MTIPITETAFISHGRTDGEVTHGLKLNDDDHRYYLPRNKTPVGSQLPTPLHLNSHIQRAATPTLFSRFPVKRIFLTCIETLQQEDHNLRV
jgi:hypothetical protein